MIQKEPAVCKPQLSVGSVKSAPIQTHSSNLVQLQTNNQKTNWNDEHYIHHLPITGEDGVDSLCDVPQRVTQQLPQWMTHLSLWSLMINHYTPCIPICLLSRFRKKCGFVVEFDFITEQCVM